jgi:hypothetical protein
MGKVLPQLFDAGVPIAPPMNVGLVGAKLQRYNYEIKA